jgi:hypothetical protein
MPSDCSVTRNASAKNGMEYITYCFLTWEDETRTDLTEIGLGSLHCIHTASCEHGNEI